MSFPHYSQLEYSDCGATCLRIILKYYKKNSSLPYLRELCQTTRVGVSMKDLVNAAQVLHFEALTVLCTQEWLEENAVLPCIIHWKQEHFVVLYKISNGYYYISDPGFGKVKLKAEHFNLWWKDSAEKGIALLLEPRDDFNDLQLDTISFRKVFQGALTYYRSALENQYRNLAILFLIIAAGSTLIYLFPKTMQMMVDNGIKGKNVGILWSILWFQLSIVLGQTLLNWLQGWLRVKISMDVSVRMVTQLLHKIIKLPVKYFDLKTPTDIFQRIEDQKHIERFISEQLLQTVFSAVLTVILGARLFAFSAVIGTVFFSVSLLSIAWLFLFYRFRRQIDYTNFRLSSENHNLVTEMITGMVEIKVNNSQHKKISQWSDLQAKIFSLKKRTLHLSIYQNFGVQFITQLKNIVITFISAYWVINGHLTLGAMLSIGYIIGLLSSPIESLASFSQSAQDAQLSLTRLDEIMSRENEVTEKQSAVGSIESCISINNLVFKYEGSYQNPVLTKVNVKIPVGKVTAIVGNSGSGKTTLVKLLLSFYQPTSGNITLDNKDLNSLNPEDWRERCGIVLQDGYIFSGTIADNIAVGEQKPDMDKLWTAARIACIEDFIMDLPMRFNSKVGNTGVGISGGQKQRILIARAVYKNPDFIFLDEATSALDSNNEKRIMANLTDFFRGKTVIIIAHRLSTVKNADQILVLDGGKVSETGHHQQLTQQRGRYFELVKNQLELGN